MPQGWYSVEYNEFEPSPAAIFSKEINETSIFTWLLIPGKGKVPNYSARVLEKNNDYIKINVKPPQEKSIEIKIPFEEGSPQFQ